MMQLKNPQRSNITIKMKSLLYKKDMCDFKKKGFKERQKGFEPPALCLEANALPTALLPLIDRYLLLLI